MYMDGTSVCVLRHRSAKQPNGKEGRRELELEREMFKMCTEVQHRKCTGNNVIHIREIRVHRAYLPLPLNRSMSGNLKSFQPFWFCTCIENACNSRSQSLTHSVSCRLRFHPQLLLFLSLSRSVSQAYRQLYRHRFLPTEKLIIPIFIWICVSQFVCVFPLTMYRIL